MKKLKIILSLALAGFAAIGNATAQGTDTNFARVADPAAVAGGRAEHRACSKTPRFSRPRTISKPHYGVVVQTRAVALPQVQATGQYKDTDPDAIESSSPDRSQRQPELERRPANRPDHLRGRQADGGGARGQGHQAAGAGAISGHPDGHAAGRAAGVLRHPARGGTNHRERDLRESAAKGAGRPAAPLRRGHGAAFQRPARRSCRGQRAPAVDPGAEQLSHRQKQSVEPARLQSAARHLGQHSAELDRHARRRAISDQSARRAAAGAGPAHRTGRVAQDAGTAAAQHHRRHVRLQAERLGLRRLQLVQRAIHRHRWTSATTFTAGTPARR